MKRVKSACILQTLVFMQKEDCGLSKNSILETNRREFEHYKQTIALGYPKEEYSKEKLIWEADRVHYEKW